MSSALITAAGWTGVAAVPEKVHKRTRDLSGLGSFQQGEEMVYVGMDTAVAHLQTDHSLIFSEPINQSINQSMY